jgi:DNA polymerase I-like protein with 3'-5' exonuclease and polymerase domains
MRKFNTATLDAARMRTLSDDEAANIYNGLDCCVTFEVYERLMEELAEAPENYRYTYEMAMAKQAPILEISMRGIRIDIAARDRSIAALRAQLRRLDDNFQRIMQEVFGHRMNWDSPVQLKTFFYGTLGLREIKARSADGTFKATVNEDALKKMCQHFYAQPFARYVMAMREIRKKIGFLETDLDYDNRLRCNLNIAGTNTGRLSSSMNDFGTGTNLQNVDNTLRYPFIADPKRILVNIDLEQADARNVGATIYNLFYDEHGPAEAGKYLDACESGDLHTRVCSMAWQEFDWTGDRKLDRAIADSPAFDGFTFRDLAKRLGHGTNYLGTPTTMAKHTGAAVKIIAEFQERYFRAFPLLPEWHRWVLEQIKMFGTITTLYGRTRHFFGRPDDQGTWRKAVAYAPQSMTGHQIDMGILNLWRNKPEAELLMQVHDSILLQVPWHRHDTHVEEALRLLRYDWTLKGGRIFHVPLEAQVGWNWGKVEKDKTGNVTGNPYGIQVWKGAETRTPPAPTNRLADYF